MNNQLELSKFNMKSIIFNKNLESASGPVIVMIGKRDTGKSFLIRDLLYHHQDVPVATVISGTEQGNGFYGKIVPRLFIHNEYDSQIVGNILNRQKKILKQIKNENISYGKCQVDPRTVLIMDDCLYDSSWAKDKLMRFLFMNGRHWKVMLIITMQYPLGIPPTLRTNIDYVFILRDNILKNRKTIWENYASMFPSVEAFCMIMDQTTENYECLVIHNGSKSNKITDQIFWYKAEERSQYKLGAKQFWDLSEQIPVSDDEDDLYNPTSGKKKTKENIVVKKKNTW
jgi:hypothetical protein